MSSENTPTAVPPSKPTRGCAGACFQALVILFVLVGAVGLAAWFGPPILSEFMQFHFRKLSDQVLKQSITETFRAHLVEIASTNGNTLELATKVSDEAFDRSTELYVAGFKVPFFDTKVTLKTRATYRYHIKLDGVWRLRKEGLPGRQTLVVLAPKIEPTLPVAFDSGAMEAVLKGYWVSMYHQELSHQELRKGLTAKLGERAGSRESIDSVREACRQSVAMFVKNWLLAEDQWRAEGIQDIRVFFPDEQQKDGLGFPPTLEIGGKQGPG